LARAEPAGGSPRKYYAAAEGVKLTTLHRRFGVARYRRVSPAVCHLEWTKRRLRFVLRCTIVDGCGSRFPDIIAALCVEARESSVRGPRHVGGLQRYGGASQQLRVHAPIPDRHDQLADAQPLGVPELGGGDVMSVEAKHGEELPPAPEAPPLLEPGLLVF
jgi:hypothetical protein